MRVPDVESGCIQGAGLGCGSLCLCAGGAPRHGGRCSCGEFRLYSRFGSAQRLGEAARGQGSVIVRCVRRVARRSGGEAAHEGSEQLGPAQFDASDRHCQDDTERKAQP